MALTFRSQHTSHHRSFNAGDVIALYILRTAYPNHLWFSTCSIKNREALLSDFKTLAYLQKTSKQLGDLGEQITLYTGHYHGLEY